MISYTLKITEINYSRVSTREKNETAATILWSPNTTRGTGRRNKTITFRDKVTVNHNGHPSFYSTSKYESEQRTMQFNGINTLLDLNVVGFIALSTKGFWARYLSKLAQFTHRFHYSLFKRMPSSAETVDRFVNNQFFEAISTHRAFSFPSRVVRPWVHDLTV